jgi:hypothetical protein
MSIALPSEYDDEAEGKLHRHPEDKEGWLMKRGAHNTSYRKRYFVLRNKVLKYYQKQKDINPKGKIMMQGCQIRPILSKKLKKNRFEFEIYSNMLELLKISDTEKPFEFNILEDKTDGLALALT